MAMEKDKLDAIFIEESENKITKLSLEDIEPNKNQPRKSFDTISISELAESVKQHGILQPLIVRKTENNKYEIVAGERRWRACKIAGLTDIPVIIKDISDNEAMELALIENLQRENLNVIEEAMGYKVLAEEHGYTQEKISQKVGKSRPVITNALRILKLPDDVKKSIKEGKISSGHAKALLSFKNEKDIEKAANLIAKKGISVRETEKLARDKKFNKSKNEDFENENFYKETETCLSNALNHKVKIKHNKNIGTLEIMFTSKEELEKITNLILNKTNN